MTATPFRLAGAMVLCAAVALAQSVRDHDRAEEYERLRRLGEQNKAEVQRLVDRRMAHDLGLPVPADPTAPRSPALGTAQKERMLQEWRDEEARTASSLARFNELRAQLERLQADVAARATARGEDEYVVVPQPGTAQRRDPARPLEAVEQNGPEPRGQAPAPLAAPAGEADVSPLGRVRGQIQGSSDHLQVAQALFKAGQTLMQRGDVLREHGDPEGATALDDRAKSYLERATAELQPLLGEKEPSYAALFCKGRSLELMFRYAERYEGLSLQGSTRAFQQREQEVREPFLAIVARDVVKKGARGEVEALGAWGMAAQAAVGNFKWINQYGSYKPSTPIGSITWPGDKAQDGNSETKQQ